MVRNHTQFMKPSLLLLSLLFFAGCQQEYSFSEDVPVKHSATEGNSKLSTRIDYREALEIAEHGISMLESGPATRSATGIRTIDSNKVKYLVVPATRNTARPDTLMYVFNFADSAGFALVAADRRADQLLAVTEQGCYTPGKPTGNPGFDWYMECTEAYLRSSVDDAAQPAGYIRDTTDYIFKLENDDKVETAGPFLTVKWGQDTPYNMYCFNADKKSCYSGCVATAIAQIMTYHSHPSSIRLTYSGTSKTSQPLDWDTMKRHVETGFCGSDCTGHEMIGQLLREIGQQVKMRYGYDGSNSGAVNEDVPAGLSRLGYSSSPLSDYDFKTVAASLRKKKPVYMGGFDGDGRKGGHAWVADGFRIETYITRTWKSIPRTEMWILDREEIDIRNYVHYNWGWNGLNNGYFSSSVFDVSAPHELDEGSFNIALGNFSRKVQTIANISPNL